MEAVRPLFGDWQESLIWSCLQGVMGEIYVDDVRTPASAMAILGDFCYFAGKPQRELVLYKPESCQRDFMIMVPQSDAWGAMIEACYPQKAKRVTRYAIKKEPDVFDREKLRQAAEGLSPEYSWKLIDEEVYRWCKSESWCRDWTGQYPDYETYRKNGLGVVILRDGVPVSGASSYSHYRGGIEIEIDTHEAYRRRGLAYACAARLILECLERGLYPSWDAQNPWSVALAKKLGYHFDREYTAYEIWGY